MQIAGFSWAVPGASFKQSEAARGALALSLPRECEPSRAEAIYARTGVGSRHTVLGEDFIQDLLNGTRTSGSPFLPGPLDGPSTAERMRVYAEEAGPLAFVAAEGALQDSVCLPSEITHLVTISCTGFAAPGVDRYLIETLGLPPSTERVHVGFMGCHGFINGLRVASALVAQDPKANVLMVAVELCTLHHAYRPTMDQLVANALFADGAAAMVLNRAGKQGRVVSTASQLLPNTAEQMGWIIGDFGFEMSLSKSVSQSIATHLRGWLSDWLARSSLTLADITGWAVHPGGPRILDAVQQALDLPPEALQASKIALWTYGNMSSPTVAFIWDRLRQTPGPIVMLAFGPGLTAEAALILPSQSPS
ncbi:MAG: type III polyketide synthase [Fimbriiglobus sp.]